MTADQMLATLARRQFGLVSRAQALNAGLSPRQIMRRQASGRWKRVRRGVYLFAGANTCYEQAVLAAVLAVGRPAWASHRTAAKLYGLPVSPPDHIDVTFGGTHYGRLPGVRSHSSLVLAASDVSSHRGIPITTPARTIVDVSVGLTVRQVGRLIDRAERDGLCGPGAVARCVARLAEAPGRSTLCLQAALTLRLPGYGPGDSDLEQDALAALAAAGLPLPERHFVVQVDGHRYEIDLAYPERRIAIELLGFRDHGHRSAFDDDSERTRRLILNGWCMLPFTSVTEGPQLAADVGRLLRLRSA